MDNRFTLPNQNVGNVIPEEKPQYLYFKRNEEEPHGYNALRGPSDNGPYTMPRQQETVGEHIFNVMFRPILNVSHTRVRVDLVRPYVRVEKEEDNGTPAGTFASTSGTYYRPNGVGNGGVSSSDSWISNLRGARLKLMQVWDFPEKETGLPRFPWGMNFGLGANFDLAEAQLQPKLRIRCKYFGIHLLPHPELEIRTKHNLGNTGIALDVHYRLPVKAWDEIWEGEGGPRMLINLSRPFGTGIHLSPGGLEFDERVWRIGKHTNLRAAALVEFPRQLPLEGQQFKVQVKRLGFKTRLS